MGHRNGDVLRCSFCGKSQRQVKKLMRAWEEQTERLKFDLLARARLGKSPSMASSVCTSNTALYSP